MPLSGLVGSLAKLWAQQDRQVLIERLLHAILITHQHLAEEGLVHLPADSVRRSAVQLGTVPQQHEHRLQLLDHLFVVARTLKKNLLGVGQLPTDPALLSLEEVQRDGVGVVRLQQLLLLALQREHTALLGCLLLTEARLPALQVLDQEGPELLGLLLGQVDALVQTFDTLLDQLDPHHALPAVRPTLLLPQAEEVRVDHAVPVLHLHDRQPAVALQAEDRALQVVVVDALLLAAAVVSPEHGLHPIEGLLGDQRFVVAR